MVARRSSRSAWSIVRSNVLTRFNAILGVLLVVVLVFGPPQDGLFGLVIVVNSAVGIVQELRAKSAPPACSCSPGCTAWPERGPTGPTHHR